MTNEKDESKYVGICEGKLKHTYTIAPYWLYIFGTFSVIRRAGTDIGLRINKLLDQSVSVDMLDKYMILGDPDIYFSYPVDMSKLLKLHYKPSPTPSSAYADRPIFALITKKK